MKKLVLFMHTSLDGFVAGPNGEIDWINVDKEIFDYAGQQTEHADIALYGRVTFGMMEGYWPTAAEQPGASEHDINHSRWYNNVRKVVLSRTLDEAELNKTQVISDNVKDEILKLKHEGGKNILMFGSPGAAHELMKHGLIDEYWLFINPILLGSGIPVFSNIPAQSKLKLLSCNVFSSGVLGVHYSYGA
jgi:dihydrofolate reductase